MTVLIVDDVNVMRLVIKDTLIRFFGVKPEDIFEADSGEKAVIQYRGRKPDVVFLDITMPDMDGISTLRAIMQTNPSAYVIMCTSSNDKVDVLECICAGAKDYIKKPIKADRVIKALEPLLRPSEPVAAGNEEAKNDS